MCVPGHAIKVKLLWTQLCMRMSKYIWISMWNFFFNFLKFFQQPPSAHIFINCTNLSKFVKFVLIVFDTYLNFIKHFWNFLTSKYKILSFLFCEVYTNSFIIYPCFLNIFSRILKFPGSFSKYSPNFFFQNFQEYYSKSILTFF